MNAVRFGSHIRLNEMAPIFKIAGLVSDKTVGISGNPQFSIKNMRSSFGDTAVQIRGSVDGDDVILQTNTANGDYYYRDKELTGLYKLLAGFQQTLAAAMGDAAMMGKMNKDLAEVTEKVKASIGFHETHAYDFKNELVFAPTVVDDTPGYMGQGS